MAAETRRDHDEPLRGLSHFFQRVGGTDPHQGIHISAIVELGGVLDKVQIVELIHDRVLSKCARLRSVVEKRGSCYAFKDLGPDWRPVQNVTVSDQPISCPEEALQTLISKQFQPGLPPWEFILCNQESKTILMIRFHHSLLDGFSIVQVLDALTDPEDEDPRWTPTMSTCDSESPSPRRSSTILRKGKVSEEKANWFINSDLSVRETRSIDCMQSHHPDAKSDQMKARYVYCNGFAKSPYSVIKTVAAFTSRAIALVWLIIKQLFLGLRLAYNMLIFPLFPDSKTAFAPYCEIRGKNSVCILPDISLSALKAAAKSADPQATINDALLAVICGAVLRYLKDEEKFPCHISAGFTANLRDMRHWHQNRWPSAVGNRSIEFYCPIPGDKLSLSERIGRIAKYTRSLKEGPMCHIAPLILDLVEVLFDWMTDTWVAAIAGDRYRIARTFQLSNVPGPLTGRKIGEVPIVQLRASVNLSQMFTCFSYRGIVRSVASLDSQHVDPQRFKACFQEEALELKELF